MKKVLKIIAAIGLSFAMTFPIYTLFYFVFSPNYSTLSLIMSIGSVAFFPLAKRIVFRNRTKNKSEDNKEQSKEKAEPEVAPALQENEEAKAETFCTRCKKEIPSESAFCPHCGNKLSVNKPLKAPKNDSKKQFISGKAVIVILIISVLLFISSILLVVIRPETKPGNTQTEETTPAEEFDYYIGNKSTKVYHDPDCKYLPTRANQVKIRKNRSGLATLNDYEPCWHCKPEPPKTN